MAPGRLITIEGIDGAGKTTLGAGLRTELAAHGHDVHLLREPGGVRAAERIREIVQDPGSLIGSRAEALLYAAARAQLVDEALQPLLASGALVLLDRFVDSSLAYQGAGRKLGVDAIGAINAFATGELAPDRTLLLRLAPAAARARSRERSAPPDRLELEAEDFFVRVAAAYDELAACEPGRIAVIDASQSSERVLADALAAVADLVS